MFTPFSTTAIPLHCHVPLASNVQHRELKAIELMGLGILLLGSKVLSNNLVTILLHQFFGG